MKNTPIGGDSTAIFLLVVMGSLWGLQFAMLKFLSQSGYSDLSILMVALFLLSLIFSGLMVIKRQFFKLDFGILRFFTITSLLGYLLPLLAVLYAAAELSAGILTLFACMAPVVATSLALSLRTEKVRPTRVAAVLLGVASAVLILLPELQIPDQGKLRWMLVALVVPLAYGIESIYISRHWPKGLTALQVVTGETVAATILVAPIFLFVGSPLPNLFAGSEVTLAIVIFVGAGVLESLLYFRLIQQTGGVFVNFGTFISLFAGIAWGMILFSESHSANVWASATILILAIYLAREKRA
ncbi:MAG: DMT family transporter [Pseudomonadota bacterium]